jgi:hypothetical protein
MVSANSLQGVMKWLRRDEWREAFTEVLEKHLKPACSKWDLAIEELPSVIGEDWYMNLWGCAFEDFLTREYDGNRNIVDDYLKRRGWKESASNKAYMTALRSSVISLYEISDIVSEESFLARDLVRGGDPIRVSEKSATRSLHPWDRIAARLLRLRAKTVMAGGVLRFELDVAEDLLDSIARAGRAAREKSAEFARQVGREVNDPIITTTLSDTGVLSLAAPLFTSFWLADALKASLDPPDLEIHNGDGEELLFSAVYYPLKPGTSGDGIRSALFRLPDLRQENDHFWNWIRLENANREEHASGIKEDVHTFTTTLDGGAIVLGTLELREKELVLQTNSQRRADRGRAMLQPVIDGLVREPLIKMQTLDQLIQSRSPRAREMPSLGLSPEEERRIVHAGLDRHYARMLDSPVPILGNIRPCEAAKTAEGRDKLVAWLKYLENCSAKHDPSEPMANYDFAWLWAKLGVTDLRC